MEHEIDDDALAAMLAEDENEEKEQSTSAALSFAEQAEKLSPEQLVELTCSLIDIPATTKTSSNSKTLKYRAYF